MNPSPHNPEPSSAAEPRPVAFCQNCGRPLTKETVRIVGPAVYCEPCLAARLNSGPAYQPVPPGAASPAWISTGQPNPNLAALLGLIPGVGAMYNEQYAKGIAHLFIFAVLVSLSHISEVFGLLLSGWIFYMAIEAHHTAKARRDGTPLPNPFGLNDIGERLGFDANLRRTSQTTSQSTPPMPGSSQTPPYAPPYVPPVPSEESAYRAPEPIATWGAPVDVPAYAPNPDFVPDSASAAYQPYTQSQTQPWPPQPPASSSYPPTTPPYGPHIDAPPLPLVPASRFPAAAIGLMVLGAVFLLGTTGIFHSVSGPVLVGFGLIGLGAWVFTRRFTSLHTFQNPADASNYRLRTLYALHPSVWLALIGTLMLLDALRLLRWSHSWPWIIIFSGLLLLLKRSIPAPVYIQPTPPTPPLATDFSQPPSSSFREGR